MNNLVYHTLGYHHATQFAEGFSEPDATVGYVTLGKSSVWNATDDPPTIGDNDRSVEDVWNAMFGGKKVVGNDVSLVLTRRNWTANTIYTAYDDQANTLFSTANGQYVYTSAGSVYRCVDNANNSLSTVEPTGDYSIDHGFIETADGYVWKYEYAIVPTNKFITTSWIPVPESQVLAYYGSANNVVDGAVCRLIVTSGGTGYSNTNTTITIVGNGVGATANATVVGGAIQSCDLLSYGSGYTTQNCSVTVTGSGTGASIRPVLGPYGGHAYNPAKELGANTVMIAMKIGNPDSTEGGKISANNEFRQIALVLGPHKYNEQMSVSSANANAAVLLSTTIVMTTGADFTRDEVVYQGMDLANATYRATVTDYFVNDLFVTEQSGTIQIGSVLKGNTSTVTRTVVNVVAPELESGSGRMVYVENRAPVSRAIDQAENIKFVVSF